MARPSSYTIDKATEICAILSEGVSLRSICRQEDMPDCKTVYLWMRQNPEFLQQYAIAKEESADALVEEMLDIADDATNDWMERNEKDNNGWVANGENVARSRLRVDTRKWAASKLKPKKYGDSTTIKGSKEEPLNLSLTQIIQDLDGRSAGLPETESQSE